MPGTAPGIAGRTSTTARRWAPHRMTNAGLIPSPNPGRSFPAKPRPAAPAKQWLRSTSSWFAVPTGLSCSSRPLSTEASFIPGYIKGYVPGIRENGGQYTHAATWVVQAFAMLGQGNRAVELFRLLNPILNAPRPEAVERYRVEPYVVAADVYSEPPHTGRGGWTWYTGSAGWLYRVGLESILGFRLHGDRLTIDPCISSAWPGYTIVYRYGTAKYRIHVANPHRVEKGVDRVELDGSAD